MLLMCYLVRALTLECVCIQLVNNIPTKDQTRPVPFFHQLTKHAVLLQQVYFIQSFNKQI
jgi:hypothetical protein